jgi:hypothetical protein
MRSILHALQFLSAFGEWTGEEWAATLRHCRSSLRCGCSMPWHGARLYHFQWHLPLGASRNLVPCPAGLGRLARGSTRSRCAGRRGMLSVSLPGRCSLLASLRRSRFAVALHSRVTTMRWVQLPLRGCPSQALSTYQVPSSAGFRHGVVEREHEPPGDAGAGGKGCGSSPRDPQEFGSS